MVKVNVAIILTGILSALHDTGIILIYGFYSVNIKKYCGEINNFKYLKANIKHKKIEMHAFFL